MYLDKDCESEHFLSFVQDSGALVEQAANETGFDVFVSHTNGHGEEPILSGFVAVWTREIRRDHGPFWDRFRELRKEQEAE